MKKKLLLLIPFIVVFTSFSNQVSASTSTSYCATYATGNGNLSNQYIGWSKLSSPPTNRSFSYITLSYWNSLSREQKLLTYPVYTNQIPVEGCSSLSIVPTTTTLPTTTTTVPPTTTTTTTTTTIAPTTTTTTLSPTTATTTSTTTTTAPLTTTTTTTTTLPATTWWWTPTTTIPKVLASSNAYSSYSSFVPKYKKVKVKQTLFYRTGAICRDGWRSRSTGSGTCSWHGGVRKWLGYKKTTWVTKNLSVTPIVFGNCYGCISSINGLPKNNYVSGYFKSNGTYVNGYWKSK